jgi:hypothetical protein
MPRDFGPLGDVGHSVMVYVSIIVQLIIVVSYLLVLLIGSFK